MEVVLYSNHCPQCKYLTTLLNQKNISYEEINDEDYMRDVLGLMSMPQLNVDGVTLKFADALAWVNKQ